MAHTVQTMSANFSVCVFAWFLMVKLYFFFVRKSRKSADCSTNYAKCINWIIFFLLFFLVTSTWSMQPTQLPTKVAWKQKIKNLLIVNWKCFVRSKLKMGKSIVWLRVMFHVTDGMTIIVWRSETMSSVLNCEINKERTQRNEWSASHAAWFHMYIFGPQVSKFTFRETILPKDKLKMNHI